MSMQIVMDELESPYRTQSTEGHARVVDEAGKVVLDCGNTASAEQYAVLLNQAFQRGFKNRLSRRQTQRPLTLYGHRQPRHRSAAISVSASGILFPFSFFLPTAGPGACSAFRNPQSAIRNPQYRKSA